MRGRFCIPGTKMCATGVLAHCLCRHGKTYYAPNRFCLALSILIYVIRTTFGSLAKGGSVHMKAHVDGHVTHRIDVPITYAVSIIPWINVTTVAAHREREGPMSDKCRCSRLLCARLGAYMFILEILPWCVCTPEAAKCGCLQLSLRSGTKLWLSSHRCCCHMLSADLSALPCCDSSLAPVGASLVHVTTHANWLSGLSDSFIPDRTA